MSVKSLIAMMDKTNIAADLDETELRIIATDVLRRAQEDLESMKDWIDSVDEGLKLCKPEFIGKSDPWDGSANFKSTLLTEASNNFGNRAAIEIMRDMALVKAEIIGIATLQNVIDKKSDEVTEMNEAVEAITQQIQQMQEAGEQLPDELQQQLQEVQAAIAERSESIKQKKKAIKDKTQRADRVTEIMNWQVNDNMKEWRRDQKRLMYSLPNIGSIFKKTYYDESKGRCVSDVINYPNFIVNQATVDLITCRSFTHIIAVSKNKIIENVKNGLWVEPEIASTVKDANGDAGSNEANGVENASKNDDCFFEQYCWIDLDDDGYEEPYIVTVHKSSSSVVRIVARFNYDGLYVKFKDMKPMPILDAQRARAAAIMKDDEEFGTKTELPDAEDLKGFRVVRIDPCGVITKYGFIPSYDGSYLDMGFFHLIGALTLGVNKVTNDLLNSGTLANSQSGISAKGFRKRQGDFKFKMGQIMATEIPAIELQNSLHMFNFKEPSMTLFQLNESMKASAGSFAANVDAGGQITANTAPTTALAMVQESLMQHTAHISLIIDSMGDEFEILFYLNSEYLDNDEYRKVVGDDEASYEDDFATDGLSIVCGANPEMSSRTQRMMLADAELAQVPLVMQAGGNAIPIIKNYFKRIGSENIQEIFPNEAEMSPGDRAQMQQMKAAQEQANALQEQQNKIQELQVALLGRAEDRKDLEAQVSKLKTLSEVDKTDKQVKLTEAQELLTLEQAETEKTKNQTDMYVAHSDITSRTEELRLLAEKQEDARKIAQQPKE
jgi:hypothetical protein